MTFTVRLEEPGDIAAIATVHRAAFPTDLEARLVDALRDAGRLVVSVVAEADGQVVGHVAFSPVTVEGIDLGGVGLAPLAVLPAWQRRGVGSALVPAGLAACRGLGARFVVVLGEPAYYGRFGFLRADALGLTNEYHPGPEFQVLALVAGGLPSPGLVRYAPEFAAFG